jgi:cytoskeletal protein CcmA (bactofilin family)
VSNAPVGKYEPESRGGSASIGKAVRIVGQIFSNEDLYVDGELEGTVEAKDHKLTVGPNGTLKAGDKAREVVAPGSIPLGPDGEEREPTVIKAREVVALGSIQGHVEAADKIEIRKDARMVGNIRTARIVIEDGAYFKGSINIVKPDPPKPPAKPQQPAPAPAPAPSSAAAAAPDKR